MCQKGPRNPVKIPEVTVYFETIYLNNTKNEQWDGNDIPSHYLERYPLFFCNEEDWDVEDHGFVLGFRMGVVTFVVSERSVPDESPSLCLFLV